jgi:exodeoxyribonuclease V alpha subunit
MLDTPSVYRVLIQVPLNVNLIFIGDPGQLPPIGPGLPFHTMVKAGSIPSVTLKTVHRQDDATGIPAVAAAVRQGKPVSLRRFDPDIAMHPGVYLPCRKRRGLDEDLGGVPRHVWSGSCEGQDFGPT